MQPMLQLSIAPPASAGRAASSLSQRLPAQERHRQRPVKQQKVLLLQSHQKARQLPAPVPRNVRNECRSITKSAATSASTATTKASEAATSARGAAASKGSEIFRKRMHHQVPVVQLPRQRRRGNSAKAAKNVRRRTLSLLKQQRDRAPQLRQVQKQRLHYLPVPRQQVPGWPQPVPPPPENRQKAPHHPLQQPQRRLAKPLSKPLQQRGLLLQQKPLKQMQRLQQTMLLPLRRQPHRQPVQRRHRHHLRLLQKMRRPDKRQQRKVVPRQQQRKHQRRQAVRRLHLRAKLLLNPRQRALR